LAHKFLVSPKQFDDIGAVLRGLGEGFEHQTVDWDDIKRPGKLESAQVLFLNCAGIPSRDPFVRDTAPTIRRFVEQGGTVYASDWAVTTIQTAFPGILEFDKRGRSGEMHCTVRDRGLQEMIGRQVDVRFNTSWWRVIKVDPSVRVFVTGTDEYADEDDLDALLLDDEDDDFSARGKLPIVWTFSCGKGHVLYTSFHNEAQTSEKEKALLRFLVLRPILSKVAAATEQSLRSQRVAPGKEIIGTVGRRAPAGPFVYEARGGESLLYFLNWTGDGALRLVVRDPSGRVALERERDQPPLGCEVSGAAAGRWTCEVQPLRVPYDNFPFVLTLASSSAAAMKFSPPPAPKQPPAPKGPPPAKRPPQRAAPASCAPPPVQPQMNVPSASGVRTVPPPPRTPARRPGAPPPPPRRTQGPGA
jgi:hypothetical protein